MTISAETAVAGPFSGNGSTTAFAFNFKCFSTSDVDVYVETSAGVQTLQTLTTHYSVSLNADQDASPGGTVTMVTAPVTGSKLHIVSGLPYTRTDVFSNAGGFYPNVLNDARDKSTLQIIQLKDKLNRTVRGPIGETISGELPNAATRAGKYLAFDDSGEPTAVSALSSSVTLGAGWEDALEAPLLSDEQFIVVDTISEVENLVGDEPEDTILLLGRSAAGDIEPGVLSWKSGDQSTNVTNDPQQAYWIAPTTDATGASGAWFKKRHHIDVQDFGAVGDGSTDDTTAIQAAINWCELTGGSVIFGPNDYLVSQLTVDANRVHLVGQGTGATKIIGSSGTVDTILFTASATGGSSQIYNCGIRNLTIATNSGVQRTAGSALHLRGVAFSTVKDVKIEGCYNGVTVSGCWFIDLVSVRVTNDGHAYAGNRIFEILYEASYGIGVPSNIKLHRCDGVGTGAPTDPWAAVGFYIDSVDGLWLSDSHINKTTHGMQITGNATSGAFIANVHVDNCYFDEANATSDAGRNLYFSGTLDNNCTVLSFSNCMFRLAGIENVAMDLTISSGKRFAGLSFNNCHFHGAESSPVRMGITGDDPKDISFTDCKFYDFCTRTGTQALILRGETVRVADCDFESTTSITDVISLTSTVTNAFVLGNDFDRATFTGEAVNNAATGNVEIKNNIGAFDEESSTELTIATGAVTITGNFHTIDTESDASSDQLDTINGGSPGMVLVLAAQNSARTVQITHAVGNIRMPGAATFSLTHTSDRATLVYDGSLWHAISTTDNVA